jgi:hypothetical protein
MTEKTETPIENLSWDKNPIIQSNELNW